MPPEVDEKSEKEKRLKRRATLSIYDKLEIIKKMERGVRRSVLIDEYNIGSSTLYDIKKSKPRLMDFVAKSDPLLPTTLGRKNMRKPKLESLDKVLHEWFQLKRTEGVAVSGPMIIAKAKDFAKQMQLNTNLNFSGGWLTRFKCRHGIRNLDISSDKSSADLEVAKSYCLNFEIEIVKKYDQTTADQIYDHDKTGLQWKSLPKKKTLASFDERNAANAQELNVFPEAEGGENDETGQKITWHTAQACMDTVLKFLEQNPCFSMQDVLQGHMLKNLMLTKNLTSLKQTETEKL